MAKKTTAVAYTGYQIPQSPTSSAVLQVKVIPPYDDKGVSYKGYYKKLVAEGEYQLIPQSPFRLNYGVVNGPAGLFSTTINIDKNVFLTRLHVDFKNTTNPVNYVFLSDGVSGNSQIVFVLGVDQDHFDIDFSAVPLEFNSGQIKFTMYDGVSGAGNFINLQFYGWKDAN